jgi:hypothetical protein
MTTVEGVRDIHLGAVPIERGQSPKGSVEIA